MNTAHILLFPNHLVISKDENYHLNKSIFLQQIQKELQKDNIGVQASNNKGYHGNYNQLLGNKFIHSVIDNMVNHHIINSFGFKKNVEWNYTSMWINVNYPHTSNSPHIHRECHLSGVFYVEVPENSGAIRFFNPNLLYSLESFKQREFLDKSFEYSCYLWNPSEGEIILFPSSLQHDVDINNSSSNRISIAFNIRLQML